VPQPVRPYGAPVVLDDRDPACTDADYIARARAHRRQLDAVTIVAITGSCGKTSTKDLAAAVLGSRFRASKSEDTKNCGLDLAATVLAADPADDFLVQELGAWGPGTLDAGIEFVRPDIAVITNLRNDHFSTLHGPRGAQAEKGKLVRSLPDTGAAVLNWDDPLVRELAAWTRARIISVGTSPDAMLRANEVSARWPDPLTFIASHQAETVPVRTQLLGRHLLGSALAAIGVGLAVGMSVAECAAVLAQVPPTFRRMSPVRQRDGVTFIRDDWKAPADSFPEVLEFMADARAPRKVVVIGQISDFGGRSRAVYERVARDAQAVADTVVFVGERAAELWPAAPRESGQPLVFRTVRAANEFLRLYLTSGDLVLVKGSGPADHLDRLILDREEPVRCWLEQCGRLYPCHLCDRVRADPTLL
jgi:UDP-N-acetylmuramoyl-tripeptide--D-alanyl-D-alanine ligase